MPTVDFTKVGKSSTKKSEMHKQISTQTEEYLKRTGKPIEVVDGFTELDTTRLPACTYLHQNKG